MSHSECAVESAVNSCESSDGLPAEVVAKATKRIAIAATMTRRFERSPVGFLDDLIRRVLKAIDSLGDSILQRGRSELRVIAAQSFGLDSRLGDLNFNCPEFVIF